MNAEDFAMDDWLDLGALLDRVQDYIELGLLDEARLMLEEYEDIYEGQWEIPYLFARIHLEQNQLNEAIPLLEKALELDEQNLETLLSLFYAYAQTQRIEQAKPYLFRAQEVEPDNEVVRSALVWYYTEINELDRAIALFNQLSDMPAENAETYRNGAVALQRAGQSDEAERNFRYALELSGGGEEERDMLADQLILSGKLGDAVQLYRESLNHSPRNIRMLSRLVFCLSQYEHYDEAEQTAAKTIEYYPNSPIGYVDMAYVKLSQNNAQEALSYAEKARAISPLEAETLRAQAIALSELKRDSEAEQAFEQALMLDGNNNEIKRDYYHHLRSIEKFERMKEVIEEVIASEYPYCVEDYWFLADFHQSQDNMVESFRYLHKAYKCMPGEHELFPPMISILLDKNHLSFSAGFLLRYASRAGWNETMDSFVTHSRLRSAAAQESLRFLRFYAEKNSDFHTYVFFYYLRKMVFVALTVSLPIIDGVLFFLLGWRGLVVGGALTVVSALLYWLLLYRRTTGATLPEIEATGQTPPTS